MKNKRAIEIRKTHVLIQFSRPVTAPTVRLSLPFQNWRSIRNMMDGWMSVKGINFTDKYKPYVFAHVR